MEDLAQRDAKKKLGLDPGFSVRSVGAVFRYRGRDMDMAARILDKLRQAPFSVEELAFDVKRKPYEAG
jgi:hypothetical protein